MDDHQKYVTKTLGWISIAALLISAWKMFGNDLFIFVFGVNVGNERQNIRDQHIDFSCIEDIPTYVPQVKREGFLFPFLACIVDSIDKNHIGWEDNGSGYDKWNLVFDFPHPRTTGILPNYRSLRSIKAASVECSGIFYKEDSSESGISSENEALGPAFSIVKHYPPPWYNKVLTKNEY
mmetsp:Transcript_3754/g.5123  ORF Transcript_3754/g.5123 Transcript_3754/m.5123 type:complete len:179 (+) Transcript_3754:1306-1842(+)